LRIVVSSALSFIVVSFRPFYDAARARLREIGRAGSQGSRRIGRVFHLETLRAEIKAKRRGSYPAN